MKWYKLDKKYMLLYIKLVIVSLLYVLPLLLANVYYEDDMARTLYGATGWNGDGRPLGETLIVWLCGGNPIADLAPLPLILSILVLSYALIVYAKANLELIMDNQALILVSLCILVNPFAMANLSYRFDCVMMFTALSIPFMLFSMPNTVSGIKIFLASMAVCMVIMSLYQAAIGMCFVLCVISLVFSMLIGRGQQFLVELWRMAGIATGAVAYKLTIANCFVSKEDWRNDASHIIDLNLDGARTVFTNIVNAFNYIKSYVFQTSLLYRIVIGVMLTVSLVAALALYIKEGRKAGWQRIVGIGFVIFSPVMVFGSTFLPLMFLETLSMRSRIFISFGGFLFYIGILLLCCIKKCKIVPKVLLFICVLYQYTYMYIYGNALRSQNEYDKYIVYSMAHDLETINFANDFETISIIGQAPKSRQVAMMCNKYPFLNQIVPLYFGNDTWLSGAWVYHYLQYDLEIVKEEETDWQAIDSTEPIIKNSIYSCYLNSKKIIIYFGTE